MASNVTPVLESQNADASALDRDSPSPNTRGSKSPGDAEHSQPRPIEAKLSQKELNPNIVKCEKLRLGDSNLMDQIALEFEHANNNVNRSEADSPFEYEQDKSRNLSGSNHPSSVLEP